MRVAAARESRYANFSLNGRGKIKKHNRGIHIENENAILIDAKLTVMQ